MKNLIITLFILLCSLNIVYSQSGWTIQNSNTNVQLNGIAFTSATTGITVGNSGVIRKTTNGGTNWLPVNPPPPMNQSFFDVFIDLPINTFVTDERGTIYKTTDFGSNWINLGPGILVPINSVMFENQNTGHAVGNSGIILLTTNGGNNWIMQNPPVTQSFFDVFFPVALTGFTAGSGVILKTTNNGTNWNVVYTGIPMNTIVFSDVNTGLAGGLNGQIIRTTNSGVNWTNVNSPIPIEIVSMDLVSANPITVTAVGTNSGIIRSTNLGTNWTVQIPPLTDSFFDVFFIDINTGWICGHTGSILKTTTGGIIVGLENQENKNPLKYELSQNFPNPFNPVTRIKFDIAENSFTKILIYDLTGREVKSLVNEQLKPGTYEVGWDASDYSSGVYYYKIVSGNYSETKKMVLIK